MVTITKVIIGHPIARAEVPLNVHMELLGSVCDLIIGPSVFLVMLVLFEILFKDPLILLNEGQ